MPAFKPLKKLVGKAHDLCEAYHDEAPERNPFK